ncbi:MAG: DNA polymerase III subunit delta' [Rhodospirillales bacterium]|nr:DNA polymerase III subunit delta' [Rhodospirillales bacterium]MBO6786871.1 DNA polymerase III subunit delta' [Rhodospirillales bacterium]
MNAETAQVLEDQDFGPRHTAELIGHADAERTLLNAASGGRLPHAWLFTGPKGIGKATLAFRFARYLFTHLPGGAEGGTSAAGGLFADDEIPAQLPDSLYVDPERPVFHRVASGGHGDLMTVERKLNDRGKLSTQIRVEDVRAAIDFAHLTSSEGGYKVIIVDGAELMNRSSENAFLKILEEPPAHCVIIMVSHNPGRLLPTTRSRCRTLAMKPLTTEQVTDLMTQHMPEVAANEAHELARLSEGSIGRAMSLAAGGGLEIYRDVVNIFASLPNLDGAAVQALATKLSKAGADDAYYSGIELYRWWLSRVVLAASRGADGDVSLSAEEQGIAARVAATSILPIWLARLDQAESLIRSADPLNLDRKQVILSLFLSLA